MKARTESLPPLRSVKELDQLLKHLQYLHYSLRTEQALSIGYAPLSVTEPLKVVSPDTSAPEPSPLAAQIRKDQRRTT